MSTNQSARTFIVTAIALGGIFVIHAAVVWNGRAPLLAAYMVVAILASMLKVPLPGIPGTFSANCLVTVLAIAQLTASDVVFVSVICALVQSLWKAKKPPSPTQLAFNAGVFAIAGFAAGWTFSVQQLLIPGIPQAFSLVTPSCVFFLVNTGAISMAVALVDGASPLHIWRVWHVWALPYYLINNAIAVLIMSLAPASIMMVIAVTAPLLLGPFAVYQWFMRRVAPAVAEIS